MESTYSQLLSRLETAVGAIYEMAERYALYRRHHAWRHAWDACSAWKQAVDIAYRVADRMESSEDVPSQEDLDRLASVLYNVRELGRVTATLLDESPIKAAANAV